jgi:HAD superfamily 5'-nucleotidase-like hydrolase
MDELSSLIMNPPHEREIFANRTLNMGTIRAIGYDMDYTLINYDVARWERAMYDYLKRRMLELGWPAEDLEYEPGMAIRGLVLDRQLGNFVKPNRFGYVKRAYHGTNRIDYKTARRVYSRIIVDIRQDRWLLFTTLFDLPIACMYAQMVDKFDRYGLPQIAGYDDLAERMIYMTRVSNFLYQTPFAYLRSTRSSLPHDGGMVGGPHESEASGDTPPVGQKVCMIRVPHGAQ